MDRGCGCRLGYVVGCGCLVVGMIDFDVQGFRGVNKQRKKPKGEGAERDVHTGSGGNRDGWIRSSSCINCRTTSHTRCLRNMHPEVHSYFFVNNPWMM